MSTKLDRIAEIAKEDEKRRFFSIAHLITPEAMYGAFRSLRKDASAGVDCVTYEKYERDAERNIHQLHERLKGGQYQAQPLRRVYIPKENGKQRPISIPALEDKIVQKATVVPLGVSTGAWIVPDPLLRLEAIRQWRVFPDFASVNFHEEGAAALARLLLDRGIGIEAGLCSPEAADIFVHNGVAPRVLRILIEPQEQELLVALETVSKIREVLECARLTSPIVLHGTDNTVWELLDEALRSGYDIRIGFEDTLKLPNGETAPNNGALVSEAQRRIAIHHSRNSGAGSRCL